MSGSGEREPSEPGPAPESSLRATWLGQVGEATGPSLAIAWKSPGHAVVEIFEDVDGNRHRDRDERLLVVRRIASGVEVVELPSGADRDRLALSWREEQDRSHRALSFDGATATGSLECAWQPGFFLDDLEISTERSSQ